MTLTVARTAAVVALLALAGCGDDQDETSGTTTTCAPAEVAPTTTDDPCVLAATETVPGERWETWEGTFRQVVPTCSAEGVWMLEVDVLDDGAAFGTGTLATPGYDCGAGGSPAETIDVTGRRTDTTFRLTVVPCACSALELAVAGPTAEGAASVGAATFTAELRCVDGCEA